MFKFLFLFMFLPLLAHSEPFIKIKVDKNVYVDNKLDDDTGEVLVKCYYTINSYLGCIPNIKTKSRNGDGIKRTKRVIRPKFI